MFQGLGLGTCQNTKISKVREAVKELSPRRMCYTEMCRISVRTTLVFTSKIDIPRFLTLFLKIGFPKWGKWLPWALGLALAWALAPALALALGGPGGALGGPWGALGAPGGPWGALALALGPYFFRKAK